MCWAQNSQSSAQTFGLSGNGPNAMVLNILCILHIILYMFCSIAHVIQHIPCNRMGLPILPCNRIGFDNKLRLQLPDSQFVCQYTRLGWVVLNVRLGWLVMVLNVRLGWVVMVLNVLILLPNIVLYMFCSIAHVIQQFPCNRIGFDNKLRLQLPDSQIVCQYTLLFHLLLFFLRLLLFLLLLYCSPPDRCRELLRSKLKRICQSSWMQMSQVHNTFVGGFRIHTNFNSTQNKLWMCSTSSHAW